MLWEAGEADEELVTLLPSRWEESLPVTKSTGKVYEVFAILSRF